MKRFFILAVLANTILIASSNGPNLASSSAFSYSSSSGSFPNRYQYYMRPPPPPPPFIRCRANEVFSHCPIAVCVPKTCDEVGQPVPCPDLPPNGRCPVRPSCICREGFVRDSRGICIPSYRCPPKCNRNEVYDLCPSPCPYRTCGINDAAVPCPHPALPYGHPNCPPPKCRCKDGYYRNDIGQCVRWEDCPVCYRIAEIYDPCPAPCPPQRCDVDPSVILCRVPPVIGDPECQPGCRCIDNFVRNYTGECIPRELCPICPVNEVFDLCIAPCPPRRCDVDERLIRCAKPPQIGDPSCEAGCRCADGFVRNSDGVCVTRDQCPPTCPPNEYYSECTNANCSPENCTQVGFPIACPRIDPAYCEKGCLCNQGYARNCKGVCIPINECPSCGGDPNAVGGGMGINCGRLCSNYNKGPVSCPLIEGVNGCDCRNGYVYDSNINKCVLPQDCTPVCTENEVFSECINGGCQAKNCSQLGSPIPCVKLDPKYCIKGCLCKEGYLRADNGICVPEKECNPPVCTENEVYSECINGGCQAKNCSQLGSPIPCVKLDPKYCIKGCLCKEGYLRADNGTCVPEKECNTPVCTENEVYSECINGGCLAKNCSQLGSPIPCVKLDPKYCIKGCLCKEGYLRADNGICIPEKECNPQCFGLNEVYDPCPSDCSPQTCESLNKTYFCPLQTQDNSNCKGKCVCKEGYYRNKIGECILKEDCLKCTGPNEYFSCGGACDNVCATLSEQNQTNCPIVNIVCNKMCYCEKDYARAANKTCIPIDQCVNELKCPVNERYDTCPAKLRSPQYCSQLGFPIETQANDDSDCSGGPGCVCIDGYVRNDTGVCIPKEECPSCGGDTNAVSGSGVNCNKRCEDLGKENNACILIYYENSCDCRDGFYYDSNTKRCVSPEECTDICPKDEVFDSCSNGGCDFRNCSQIGGPKICIDPVKCKTGCKCKKDYLRLENGTCVPIEQCPQAVCGKNERFEKCPIALCQPQSCDQLDGPIQCPAVGDYCPGEPGCICIDGYVYNDKGECIPKEKCPIVTSTPTEVSGTTALADYNRGNDMLTSELLYQLVESRPGESFMVSATSVLIALAPVALNAEGVVLEQLLRILNLKSQEQIRTSFPILIKSYQEQQQVILKLVSQYYGNIKAPFAQKFIQESKAIFNAEVENLDYDNNNEAAEIINDNVAQETNDLIKNLISPDSLNADTRAVLVNALYFLGNWKFQFNPNNTIPRDFYVSENETISIPTMFQQREFLYGESNELDCKILTLPYKGDNFTFTIYLPNTRTGLKNMIMKLRNPQNFVNSQKLLTSQRVRAFIPVMDIATDVPNLKEMLIKANLTAPFDPKYDGLKGIVKGNETLYISDAIQKSRIKVDETGTEAAVASAILISATSAVIEKINTFEMNRPSSFYLTLNGQVIMSGVFAGK